MTFVALPALYVLLPDGRYLYFDAGHLTLEGSRRVGARLKEAYPELFRSAAQPSAAITTKGAQ